MEIFIYVYEFFEQLLCTGHCSRYWRYIKAAL